MFMDFNKEKKLRQRVDELVQYGEKIGVKIEQKTFQHSNLKKSIKINIDLEV